MRMMKIVYRVFLVLLIIALGTGIWLYFFDGASPESRPDLVRLPDSTSQQAERSVACVEGLDFREGEVFDFPFSPKARSFA